MKYQEINCRQALNKLSTNRLPYKWDLNIYRGCQHGCRYCYALYTHQYLNDTDFYGSLYVKANIVEQLERELKAPGWNQEAVNIGGVTDSYQPAEAHYKLMPEILRLLIKYKTPALISTKSELILRDYDLIAELASLTHVNIAATITSPSEAVRRRLEPGAASPKSRFAALREFRKTKASIGLHLMPIIPYITDDPRQLEELFAGAKEIGVDYLLPGILYLRGATRPLFYQFVKEEFPSLYLPLLKLFKNKGQKEDYKFNLYKTINTLSRKYEVSRNYKKQKLAAPVSHAEQLVLF